MKKLNVDIPDKVINVIDRFVDGTRYRNRTQLISTILYDWVEEKKWGQMMRFNLDSLRASMIAHYNEIVSNKNDQRKLDNSLVYFREIIELFLSCNDDRIENFSDLSSLIDDLSEV